VLETRWVITQGQPGIEQILQVRETLFYTYDQSLIAYAIWERRSASIETLDDVSELSIP
jgi:hypothetical protein